MMKRFLSLSLAVVCCICLLVATERRAYAYVDPGSGLLAIQSIASVAAATGYFMRRKIAALFGRKKPVAKVVEAPVKPNVFRAKDTRSAA